MATLVLVSFLVSVQSMNPSWNDTMISNFDDIDHVLAFKDWQQHFDKTYEDTKEESHRFLIFLDNWKMINDHNTEGQWNYTMALNQFGDLTHSEFLVQVHGHTESCLKDRDDDTVYKLDEYRSNEVKDEKDNNQMMKSPEAIDWTNINGSSYVTPVKNQGSCGSCWAFSTVGSLESFAAIKNGWTDDEIITLSEQQLVDCAYAVPRGCQGGLQEDGFKYVQKHGGLCTEKEYPYKGHDNACKADECGQKYNNITGYKVVPKDSEQEFMAALAMGPIAVSVDAAGPGWQFYKEGVYSRECLIRLDHGVLGVGYGHDEKGGDFWKIKNSWGTDWGEKGFMRICRNCDKNGNMGECGILRDNSYPIM